jgi:hypothetical protein
MLFIIRFVPKTQVHFVTELRIFIAKRISIWSTLRFKVVLCLFYKLEMALVKFFH